MERDTSSDRGGDQAAWRDLVARLELPQAIDPADAPWPDRENLSSARHASRQDTGRSGSGHRDAGKQGQDGSGRDEPETGQGHDVPVSRRRVIRPATFLRYAETSQLGQGDAGRAGQPAGRHAVPPARQPGQHDRGRRPGEDGQHDRGRRPGEDGQHDRGRRPGEDGTKGPDQPARDGRDGLGGGLDFQALADLEFFDEGADAHYVPPQIPPLPKLDPIARGAWTALFGGPGYLFLATTLSWQVPGWAELAAITAFIAGFVVLVSRLGDGPSRKDGPDQGAVV